jgi:hypothetical protein
LSVLNPGVILGLQELESSETEQSPLQAALSAGSGGSGARDFPAPGYQEIQEQAAPSSHSPMNSISVTLSDQPSLQAVEVRDSLAVSEPAQEAASWSSHSHCSVEQVGSGELETSEAPSQPSSSTLQARSLSAVSRVSDALAYPALEYQEIQQQAAVFDPPSGSLMNSISVPLSYQPSLQRDDVQEQLALFEPVHEAAEAANWSINNHCPVENMGSGELETRKAQPSPLPASTSSAGSGGSGEVAYPTPEYQEIQQQAAGLPLASESAESPMETVSTPSSDQPSSQPSQSQPSQLALAEERDWPAVSVSIP